MKNILNGMLPWQRRTLGVLVGVILVLLVLVLTIGQRDPDKVETADAGQAQSTTTTTAEDPPESTTTTVEEPPAPETTTTVPTTTTTTAPPPTTTTTTVPPPPPEPEEQVIVIDNRVTNGPHENREDRSAYLSTRTEPFCKLQGCAVRGTNMGSGDELTVHCQTQGDEMTNGRPEDEGNPIMVTSSLWYGVFLEDDEVGYISEVFVAAEHRGGLGLPNCP